MARLTKKDIYAEKGVQYDPETGKILAPVVGWINPLLINGNTKLGKGVWTFSTLAGNKVFQLDINGTIHNVLATCPCNCKGCYAQSGNYNFYDVKNANARKTFLARLFLDFVKNAIIAQIKADKIKLLRIHASGDFFSIEYINAWKEIVNTCADCVFWTYTKNPVAEKAFNDCANCNVVKSIIPGYGFNFGHCDYIIRVYKALKAAGKSVYICRCGIDKNQHCTNCKGCSKNDYVLFIEHSTNYVAEIDPCFAELKAIIEAQ